MKEVLRTNDPVRLSYAVSLLEDAGLQAFVMDAHMASMEGGISAFQRRVMVADAEEVHAKEALKALDAPFAATDEAGG